MQYRKLLLHLALLSFLLVGSAYSAVEIYDASASLFVPTFIDYTLNCTADVTVEILPCTWDGTPAGSAVRTITWSGQSKGFHRYIWLGDVDGGGTAPYGYYVPRITATADQPQWGPISGLYLNSDWDTEYAPMPWPSVPDVEGFYGVGINKNPNSAYYGRMYVSHKTQKDIYMYGPAGNYLGKFNDAGIAWGASAPWDLAVADDGWVYVSDRSNMIIHCFSPDGNLASTSPTVTNMRAIFARTTPDGRTHIFMSGSSTGIKKVIVEPDHLTWTLPITTPYNTGGGDGWDAYGMWVSPDLRTIYQACNQGPSVGLTRWNDPESDGIYVRDMSFTCGSEIGACIDVDFVDAAGSDYLWTTRMTYYANDNPATTPDESSRAIYKVNLDTCSVTGDPYNIVAYGLMVSADAVGNPAVTFGKSSPTWAQRYWGLFAEPGNSTAQKLLTPFTGPSSDGCPMVVPGSAVWTPDNTLIADNTDSASVSVKVIDLSGWGDITSVTLDLTPLGYGIKYAVITQDPSDPTGRTAIATFSGIKAKVGARCTTSYGQPPHYLTVTACDSSGCCSSDYEEVQAQVTGHAVNARIGHTRVAGWYVQDAQVRAVGGGIPGTTDHRATGPFTYYSTPSNASGSASIEISAGSFGVTAQKTGFGSQAPINVTAPYGGGTLDLYLRPLTVAEARATANGTKVNMEGVCFAQPVGYDCFGQIAQFGLAPRTDTMVLRNQWYVCDPNDPSNGMLCLVTKPTESFLPQWDCPTGEDWLGNSTYIGKYPSQGETIMITGLLDIPAGHERRVLVGNSDLEAGLAAGTFARTYLNRGSLGGLPSTPVTGTVADIGHPATTGFSDYWGQYVQITGRVVATYPSGNDNPPFGDTVPFALVADAQGNTCEIAIQTQDTLNMQGWWPMVNCVYQIRGAAGRTNRYDKGCIRLRDASDFTMTGDCGGPVEDLSAVRSADIGTSVRTLGVVTAKIGNSLWIESTDRHAGVRVMVNPSYVAVSDCVYVYGTIALIDGERVIQPTEAIVTASTGNFLPEPFDLRTREIGGGPCLADPGVTNGRGALNVGLLVRVQGLVTGIDPVAGEYYYLWDGANRTDAPVSDSNARGFLGVRVEAAPPAGIDAASILKDWVEVTGVVSADATIAAGKVAPTIIPTSASKVTSFDAISTSLGEGWNLIGLPAAPAGSGDGGEWSAKPWAPYIVLSPNQTPDNLDSRLYRWESCTGGLYAYDSWSEWEGPGAFGGLLLGDGYWLNLDEDRPVSYSGRNSALDQWIGVCRAGWALIGHPKDHPTHLADVKVHAGDRIVGMGDAILTEGWIDCASYWWDAETQGLMDVGIPECWGSTDTLLPWHGYWLQVYRGDLALIVPESPAAP
ncbi:MAG: hypothetical protein KBC96_08465 [Armatimonadetes bacterium]|nr:hypothetical protein [Armatimonadota bacterium]